MSILLPQAEAVVAATPFNRWDAVPTPAQAGASFVSITLARAVRSFLTRCSLSSAPADAALFSALPILEFGLNAACWTRIFDGLSESGAFAVVHLDQRDWDKVAAALVMVSPAKFVLTAADLLRAEPMHTPATLGVAGVPAVAGVLAVPAVRARGGGAGRAAVRAARAIPAVRAAPAIPAVLAVAGIPVPPLLEFLASSTVSSLERPCSSAPLALVCLLLGALGPAQTAAHRNQVASSASVVALTISSALRKRHGIDAAGAAGDAALAYHLPEFLEGCQLPAALRVAAGSGVELTQEFLAGIQYTASTEGRSAVEARRIIYLTSRCAPSPPPPGCFEGGRNVAYRGSAHACASVRPAPASPACTSASLRARARTNP